jgi:predicted transcriptional regulator
VAKVETLTEGLRVNVDIPTREELERLADEDDRSVAWIIRRAIADYLATRRELSE